jgi:hypothetical protein
MELHHTKHHQAYVNGLNAAEDAYFKAPSTRDQIALQAALKFNGGGEPPVAFRVAYLSSSQQATSTTHSFGRTSHLLRKAAANSRTASSRTQLCATLARLRGSRNSSALLLLGFREADGAGSGITPLRRSSRLSPPQIRILSSVSVFMLSLCSC